MGSVRDNLKYNQTPAGPNRGTDTDHSNETFGTLKVTARRESSRGYTYELTCSVCGAHGITVTQQAISEGKAPKRCPVAGCGITVARPERRTATFEPRQGLTGSARQRYEAQQRQAEVESLKSDEERAAEIANLGGAQ